MTATTDRHAPEPDVGQIPVRISGQLYAQLRDYCDRTGIRFVRFLEESLEKATYVDEVERLLNDGGTMLEKLEAERCRGVAHGFALGVLAATLALNGSPDVARRLTPEAARGCTPLRPVTGGQIRLFD